MSNFRLPARSRAIPNTSLRDTSRAPGILTLFFCLNPHSHISDDDAGDHSDDNALEVLLRGNIKYDLIYNWSHFKSVLVVKLPPQMKILFIYLFEILCHFNQFGRPCYMLHTCQNFDFGTQQKCPLHPFLFSADREFFDDF